MPGPRQIEIIGQNIYPQATKEFYTWPTPKRNYRREHLPQAMKKFYAWPTPKRNYRLEHQPPGHVKILCLAHAK